MRMTKSINGIREAIIEQADVIKYMNTVEAKLCKGILGYIIPGQLMANGFYSYREIPEDGTEINTLIIRKDITSSGCNTKIYTLNELRDSI